MAYRLPVNPTICARTIYAKQRGSAFIEFALVMTMLVPMFFGMVITGMSFTKALQLIQNNRDIAHMYAMGLDFSSSSARSRATQLQQSTGVYSPGNNVCILSQVRKISQSDCDAQGLPTCANLNLTVFVQRLVLGTSALRASNFGTPAANYINSYGNIAPADYLTQSSLVVSNTASLPAVTSGDAIWVVESYLSLPSLSYLSSFGVPLDGIYTVNYF